MGPIYGTFFIQMSLQAKNKPAIDAEVFGAMLVAARKAVEDLGAAKPGDKTIMDTLVPAQEKLPKRAWCRLRFHSGSSANGRCCGTRKRIDPGFSCQDRPSQPAGRAIEGYAGRWRDVLLLDPEDVCESIVGRAVAALSRRAGMKVAWHEMPGKGE